MTNRSERELDAMRKAGAIVAGALALAESAVKPGLTTGALNELIDDYIVKHGAHPSFKGYNGFPAAACISMNNEVVHGIPGKRVMQEGEIVSVDVGAFIDGHHGDAARTFAVGAIDPEHDKLIAVTRDCFFAGMKMARAGNRVGDISHAIQSLAESHGYGVVRELIGHGVGQKLHEAPDVPNFGKAGRGPRLSAGMTIAIEPMINAGTKNVYMLDDGWTVVTADGMFSAHYENTIAITDDEAEILTATR